MKILVINCGSSSIKYQLLEMDSSDASTKCILVAKGFVEPIGATNATLVQYSNDEKHRKELDVVDHDGAMLSLLRALTEGATKVLDRLEDIGAVGHRVVHGGEAFTGSVIISDHVIATIEQVADLAPLHNPVNLIGIRTARQLLPNIPQIACFDTAFHATIPQVAFMYALPYELYEKYGVRRYGFHGTSHRWVARQAAKRLGLQKYNINCITCHLGNGCSITAVKEGRSVDTSMGLTPLEGVVMGTRSGGFDPAILFYLADKGYDIESLKTMCNKESGLLGISGLSNDMRVLTDKAAQGDDRAALAVDVFCYSIKKYIGMYAAVLGRIDAVVFTGGIGENATLVREKICRELEGLGIEFDSSRNEQAVGVESEISTLSSQVKMLVIPTDEERAIAGDTHELTMQIQNSA